MLDRSDRPAPAPPDPAPLDMSKAVLQTRIDRLTADSTPRLDCPATRADTEIADHPAPVHWRHQDREPTHLLHEGKSSGFATRTVLQSGSLEPAIANA
jgi:hypothetical protein